MFRNWFEIQAFMNDRQRELLRSAGRGLGTSRKTPDQTGERTAPASRFARPGSLFFHRLFPR